MMMIKSSVVVVVVVAVVAVAVAAAAAAAEIWGKTRENSFLLQRLSVLIQCVKAVLLHDSFVDEILAFQL